MMGSSLLNQAADAAKAGAAAAIDVAKAQKKRILHEYSDQVLSTCSQLPGVQRYDFRDNVQNLEDIIRGVDLANGIYSLQARTTEELNDLPMIKMKGIAKMLSLEKLQMDRATKNAAKNYANAASNATFGRSVAELEEDIRPKINAYALYENATETLWIVVRGTVTVSDFFTDVKWGDVSVVKQLKFPTDCNNQAREMVDAAYAFSDEVLAPARKTVRRVAFAGHSLGGAVAINAYLLHLGNRGMTSLPTDPKNVLAVTLGAPLVVSHERAATFNYDFKGSGVKLDDSLDDMEHWADNVFNLICRLDIIPATVGPQPLPDSLLENSLIGPVIKKFMETLKIKRDAFVPFGNFFSVNPSFDAEHNQNAAVAVVLKAPDPVKLLNIWPDNVFHWPLSIEDHNSDVYLVAMESLRPKWTPPAVSGKGAVQSSKNQTAAGAAGEPIPQPITYKRYSILYTLLSTVTQSPVRNTHTPSLTSFYR
jgi:hypothetical protein